MKRLTVKSLQQDINLLSNQILKLQAKLENIDNTVSMYVPQLERRLNEGGIEQRRIDELILSRNAILREIRSLKPDTEL